MKAFVLFACVCAVAHAQFGNQYQQSFAQSSANRQSAVSPQRLQQRREYENQPAPQTFDGRCAEKNERYPVPGSCDRYVECVNGTAEERSCPDGLRFNPNLNFNQYPCQYPNEYSCLERSALQPAQPTDSCPHQFGFFKLGDASDCSAFRSCVNGVAFDFTCPEGLAFSSESYRCEWPDEVADCDAEKFLGFRCPEVPISKELGAPAGYRFYRSDTNCQKYFICINDKPRVLRCGGYTAFDELTSSCVSAEEVDVCPEELRIAARQVKEDEQQRLAKQIEFESRPHPHSKRRF